MFHSSKIFLITAAATALIAQSGVTQAFEGGGGGEGQRIQYQIEYSDDESDRKTDDQSRVPVLGDVPLVSNLFRNKDKTRAEVIIQVQPHVIRGR